ncbi:MAG TPA: GNAT family N-acetyltransferase [Anaerolineae bacterium]|nr:GNAT family N-acetyltransferase [Anaerolineae bacterium]HQI84963.1 GNAT family N-acetyltransferase [Anaerolineae bacterium]
MTTSTSRPYSGPADLHSMLALLGITKPAERCGNSPSEVDLRELLALPAVQNNTRLWFDADARLVGFAFVDHYNNLCFEFDDPGIESEIVAWGVQCIRRAIEAEGEALTLDASCGEDNTNCIALLERHGFIRQALRSLHLVCSLHAPIPAPQLPAGFSIRHVTGEHEVEALVALHRAAFGTENMTVEERLAMMRTPEYDAELDLVAVAPDGRLAAYCMVSISQEENARTGRNEGYTDPVATHPDFRRLGLARALLLTGLYALQQRGIDTACLGTSDDNVAMQQTALAVGFRVQSTTLWFSKLVSL